MNEHLSDPHFTDLGTLMLDVGEGVTVAVDFFECTECGSAITAREKHREIHEALIFKD